MNARKRTLLFVVPVNWAPLWEGQIHAADPDLIIKVQGRDAYAPVEIDYALSFRPPPGLFKTLPNLKAVFSLGAGVDGFLLDTEYPRHVPLVRFVNRWLSLEMAQYAVLHTLMHHRQQRMFDAFQKARQWRQGIPQRKTADTRVGILGFGEIGQLAGERLRDLGFPVAGWSRTKKRVAGIESYAGDAELKPFLARTDILTCLLPLTPSTRGILNAEAFAAMPAGAAVINAARGGHLVERDLIAALDSNHLSGATLDVFETEPLPESSPLWLHPKITVTPHVAGLTDPKEAARFVIDGMERVERGEKLDNTVDFERGY
ncbi:MAG TPA: glyoxylate/hydroxypyruvate reductase A [Rhizomicrobium sp.]|nr:glyoxylate/hydroxypyruvate reductase A [Rhizomicrobium sp.]